MVRYWALSGQKLYVSEHSCFDQTKLMYIQANNSHRITLILILNLLSNYIRKLITGSQYRSVATRDKISRFL